jgi:hypothetical protein
MDIQCLFPVVHKYIVKDKKLCEAVSPTKVISGYWNAIDFEMEEPPIAWNSWGNEATSDEYFVYDDNGYIIGISKEGKMLDEIVFPTNSILAFTEDISTKCNFMTISEGCTFVGITHFCFNSVQYVKLLNNDIPSSGFFGACDNLQAVYIGDNITSIPSATFAQCTKLRYIRFPKFIADDADNATDSSGLSLIDSGAFNGCTSLRNIKIEGNHLQLHDSYHFGNTYIKNIYITGLSSIGYASFFGSTVENIYLDGDISDAMSSVSNITYGCYNIKNIHLPSQLTQINIGNFLGSYSFVKNIFYIELPNSIESISVNLNFSYTDSAPYLYVPAAATFSSATDYYNLQSWGSKHIIIDKDNTELWNNINDTSINSYGTDCFTKGNRLTNFIKTPNFYIKSAFENDFLLQKNNMLSGKYYTTGLTDYGANKTELQTLPFSPQITVTNIAASYKSFDTGIANITSLWKNNNCVNFIFNENFKSFISEQAIGNIFGLAPQVFDNLASFDTSLLDGSGYMTEGNGLLLNADGTKLICFPRRHAYNSDILNNITTIGWMAFGNNHTIDTISIPSTLKTINDYAFYGADLTSADFSKTTFTSTPNGCFMCCSNLNEVSFSPKLMKINEVCFDYCESLDIEALSDSFPTTLTTLTNRCFGHNPLLTEFTVNKYLTSINVGTFTGCQNLTDIFVDAERYINSRNNTEHEYDYNAGTLRNTSAGLYYSLNGVLCYQQKLSYPNNSSKKYISQYDDVLHMCGEGRAEPVLIPESVKTITSFQNCTKLTKVVIPSSVTSIASSAFTNCPNLTIYTFMNSTAHQFAVDNDIKYNIIDDGTLSDGTIDESAAGNFTIAYNDDIFLQANSNEDSSNSYIATGLTEAAENKLTIRIPDCITGFNMFTCTQDLYSKYGDWQYSLYTSNSTDIVKTMDNAPFKQWINNTCTKFIFGKNVPDCYYTVDANRAEASSDSKSYYPYWTASRGYLHNTHSISEWYIAYPLSFFFNLEEIDISNIDDTGKLIIANKCLFLRSVQSIDYLLTAPKKNGITLLDCGNTTVFGVLPYAFYCHPTIEKIIVRSSSNAIMSVGSYAFYGCENLKVAIVISGTIGMYPFKDCSNLKDVVLSHVGNTSFSLTQLGITKEQCVENQMRFFVSGDVSDSIVKSVRNNLSNWGLDVDTYFVYLSYTDNEYSEYA